MVQETKEGVWKDLNSLKTNLQKSRTTGGGGENKVMKEVLEKFLDDCLLKIWS